jgi:hypothetical protein
VLPLLSIIAIGIAVLLWRSFAPTFVDVGGTALATKEDLAGIAQSLIDARVETAVALEQLRNDLQGGALEQRSVSAKLHERRAEAIDGLYRRLVRAQAAFFPPDGAGETDDRLHTEAGRTAQELSAFFDENRLYYDSELIASVGRLYSVLNEAWVALALDPQHSEQAISKGERDRRRLAWQRARGSIRELVPELRAAIEARMRQLLEAAQRAS